VLVIVVIGAVILRFVYYVIYLVTHWRDTVKEVVNAKPYEWVIAAIFVLVYYFLNRRNTKS